MTPSDVRIEISKTLSSNDLGETGGHQAGILVPKVEGILSYFPTLNGELKNPRAPLAVVDQDGSRLELMFIYYNNKRWGGTRDEYRLTHLTRWLRESGLRPGDELLFGKDVQRRYRMAYRRRLSTTAGKITLGANGGWRTVNIR